MATAQAIGAAMAALQARDYGAVEAHASAALALDAGNYDALHFLALAALHTARHELALERLDALDRLHPGDVFSLNTRGAALQGLGRLAEAVEAFRVAAQRSPPGYGDAWMNLGLALVKLGRHAEAVDALRRAQQARGKDLQLTIYLAVAMFESGDAAGAEAAFGEAAAALPSNAMLQANHAAALLRCGRAAEAAEAARRAASLDARLLMARELRVSALMQAGDPAAADREAEAARAEGVDSAKLAIDQALARLQREDDEGARAAAARAVALQPANAEAVGIEAFARLSAADLDGALEGFARARALAPSHPRWRFLEALACPPIFDSAARMASRLGEAESALQALEGDPGTLADPYRQVGVTPFYFAYLGLDDTRLQRLAARAYLAACPSLAEDPRPPAPRRRGGRIRLGIASTYLRNHSIGKLNLGFAQHLDRKHFELVVVRPPGPPDEISTLFDRAADAVLTVPWNVAAARRALAGAGLDALFYPDIGMDAFTYFLAFARLASVQFTTWGHPVTTGIPNMDVFVSSRHVEPPGAQARYHERLACFDTLPSCYLAPRPPSAFDIRAELGLAAATRLYACPQTLFKFHPDFDAALAEVLRRDPQGLVLLVSSRHRAWNERLQARFRQSAPDVAERIRFVPPMALPDFFAALRSADAILDPFHFGGGTSSYESLSMGLPVVTLPGAMMRGRITAGWYAVMGEARWVASSVADFVDRAVALAHAPGRDRVRAELAEKARATLVDNPAVVRELEAFVEAEVAAAAGR